MTREKDLGSAESVIGDEEFDFDDIVINSAAYRRAYYSYAIKAAQATTADNEKGTHKMEIETGKENDMPTGVSSKFMVLRDEDYFDLEFQRLFFAIHEWVLRFSEHSVTQTCRLTSKIGADDVIYRLDNSVLEGSDVDTLLADRVKRRDVLMAVTTNMIWEFIFTRYLFGLVRETRQRLKSLEKVLGEAGPRSAVALWRAITLTLISKGEPFIRQNIQDTEVVTHVIFEALTQILPLPSQPDAISLQDSLRTVVKSAVDLSVAMRTQVAEYVMLPPLLPEYDANGDLASRISFSAVLMNDQSGSGISNKDLEEQHATVKHVLFPLVVKKGDDNGEGDDEIVIYPAQVVVARQNMGVA
ncbi:hypothetical protein V8E51_001411 [Hyaloscypha variabilis]